MADKTSIEWTRSDDGTPGAAWNPILGCDRVSPGCDRCYAIT
jgi:protein gp37